MNIKFIKEGFPLTIQANSDETFADVCSKYMLKIGAEDGNNLSFFYNSTKIPYDSSQSLNDLGIENEGIINVLTGNSSNFGNQGNFSNCGNFGNNANFNFGNFGNNQNFGNFGNFGNNVNFGNYGNFGNNANFGNYNNNFGNNFGNFGNFGNNENFCNFGNFGNNANFGNFANYGNQQFGGNAGNNAIEYLNVSFIVSSRIVNVQGQSDMQFCDLVKKFINKAALDPQDQPKYVINAVQIPPNSTQTLKALNIRNYSKVTVFLEKQIVGA